MTSITETESIEVDEMPLLQPLSDEKDETSAASRINESVPLYDYESTLNITRDIADGFLIFLSGGSNSAKLMKKQSSKKKPKSERNKALSKSDSAQQQMSDSDILLAFAAITDGNILDATFGVHTCGGIKRHKDTSEIAYNRARAAKDALREAADSSEEIRRLAVVTYCRCFENVISYHHGLDELNLLSWCYKHQKVYDKARVDLKETFNGLSEAVISSI
jgi:hypothetical protein